MRKKISFFSLLLIVLSAQSQTNTFPSTGSAGIGTTTPNTSAILEMKSTSQGLLIPRMTLAQRNAIVNPATGLMIFQVNSSPGFYYYTGSTWTPIAIKGANITLSNLKSPTAINVDLLPDANGVHNIGNASFQWDSLWLSSDATINGITVGRGGGSINGNTAVGDSALASNGINITGIYNTATGAKALFYNISTLNTANGYASLYNNYVGSRNTAVGSYTLYSNIDGIGNTAIGTYALYSNSDGGDFNTANGLKALYSNLNGYNNTAVGSEALYTSKSGSDNVAIGSRALYLNTSGGANTAIGQDALISNTTGNFNTAIGSGANVPVGSAFSNATAIGYTAIVDASNKVRIGNTSVTSIGGQVGWTSFSDGRIKKNIKENVPGLRFINLLKPITYNYDLKKEYALLGEVDSSEYAEKNDIEKTSFTGFVAQEVDAAAKKINYDFSGVDKTGKIMGLRYSEFVVPLVKAVQELDNNEKTDVIELKKENEALKQRIEKLEAMLFQTQPTSSNSNQSVILSSSFSLEQNIPNPFKGSTTITCFLPVNDGNAYINFYAQTGSLLKSVKITGEGKNTITLTANELASGTYKYALVVDGKVINSKQMILQH